MIESFTELMNAGFDKEKIQKLTQEFFTEYDLNRNGFEWEEFLNMTLSKAKKQK